jgi:hypothetical protein
LYVVTEPWFAKHVHVAYGYSWELDWLFIDNLWYITATFMKSDADTLCVQTWADVKRT